MRLDIRQAIKPSGPPPVGGVEAFHGTFTSDNTPNPQIVSGAYSFVPKALIFYTDGQTSAGSATHSLAGFGFTSGTDLMAGSWVANNSTVGDRYKRQTRTNSIELLTLGGSVTLRGDVTATAVGQFSITWSATFSARLIHYVVLGGNDFNCFAAGYESPITASIQSHLGWTGETPTGLMVHMSGASNLDTSESNPFSSIGFASGINDQGSSGIGVDANVNYAQQNPGIVSIPWNNADFLKAKLNGFVTGGISVDWQTVRGDGREFVVLMTNGVPTTAGTFTQTTDGSNNTISLTFDPKAVFISHAAHNAETIVAGASQSFGAAASAGGQSGVGFNMVSASNRQAARHNDTTDGVLVVRGGGSSPAVDFTGNIILGTNEFEVDWTGSDSVARLYNYIAYG